MPALSPAVGERISKPNLELIIDRDGDDAAGRRAAFERYQQLPIPTAPPGRYWKRDLAKLDFNAEPSRGLTQKFTLAVGARERGVIVCDLSDAIARHADLVSAALGAATGKAETKFSALTRAFRDAGAFVYVPPGITLDAPIALSYQAHGSGFPYTLIVAGAGARFAVVEHLAAEDAANVVCGVTEIVAERSAAVSFASIVVSGGGTTIVTRRAICAEDAHVEWALADLGGTLVVDSVVTSAESRGAVSSITALFFATGDEHADLTSEVRHLAGNTTSQTIVKSAATDRGQGRYFGNIIIAPSAHGADATLRDDALLLSKTAHIDSVPALEIAANDVKAFHGATIGSIDEAELFYVQSRGIAPADAEKMIALGFFEPAIARFPTSELRDELRQALEQKIDARTAG